jgi:tape measure domain-containing protein
VELFKLWGSVSLKDDEARQGLRNIDNEASKTSGRIGGFFQRAGSMVGTAVVAGATAAVGGLTILTGAIAKTGIAYNSMMENSEVAWTTLLGTQENAKNMLEDIANFAKTTQFGTEQVDMMAKYMHNAGLEGKALFDELTKVADVSGAFNIPAAEAKELTRQMSQVRQAGLAYTEDLNVLQDRGIPIYKAISEQLGITVADVKKMASEGKLTSDIYLKAFDGIAKGVAGSSEKQSKTLSGMTSTLKDNLAMISGELTKGAFEKLKSLMEEVMPTIEQFSSTLKDEGLRAALSELFGKDKVDKAIELFNTVRDIGVTAFNLFKDAAKFVADNLNIIIPLMAGLTGAILAQMVINALTKAYQVWRAATTAQTTAQWLLNAALNANPLGLVAMAIGAVIAVGILLYKNWDKVKQKTIELWNKLGPFKGVLLALAGPFGMIIDLGVKLYKNWDNLVAKAKEVTTKIKNFFSNLKVKIPLPHFDLKTVTKNIAGIKVPVPDIDVNWYAKGTNFAPGGMAIVGEQGPELVHLPRGSKVDTANETKQMMQSSEPKQPIIIQMLMNSKIIAEETYEDISVLQNKANKITARKGGVVFG